MLVSTNSMAEDAVSFLAKWNLINSGDFLTSLLSRKGSNSICSILASFLLENALRNCFLLSFSIYLPLSLSLSLSFSISLSIPLWMSFFERYRTERVLPDCFRGINPQRCKQLSQSSGEEISWRKYRLFLQKCNHRSVLCLSNDKFSSPRTNRGQRTCFWNKSKIKIKIKIFTKQHSTEI